ncbi:MAG: dTDP-4-amino-4,6-dideoxygalactose transaminase [Acidobacteriota bacterium]
MRVETPFNRPFIAGRELFYIAQAVTLGSLGGDGHFTRRCCRLLEDQFGIPRVLLTPSCTAALELAALLCDLEPGDEVIVPSYTFVSTANAIVRTGAKPVFVDIRADTLNLDERLIEPVIGDRTKAIFPVHYAGVSCEMDVIMDIAVAHDLMVVEDAAQAVYSSYREKPLGSLGQLGTFSFHETKNYISGEGGALCVNDTSLLDRAEILRDKGTNRQRFLRGEVKKYEWVDIGSSYVPSELVGAFLYGQLEEMEHIADRRRAVYLYYMERLTELQEQGLLRCPVVPQHCYSNYHLFYILLPSRRVRDAMESYLAEQGVQAITHFEPLHTSPMGRRLGYREGQLPITESVAGRILRLPLFYDITAAQQSYVVDCIGRFFSTRSFSGSKIAAAGVSADSE